MDFLYFIKVLLKRKWLILSITVIAVGATWFITGTTEEVYKSVARIDTKMSENEEMKDKWNYEKISQTEFNRTIELMKSQTVINLLSYRLALNDLNSREPFRNADLLTTAYTREEIDAARLSLQLKSDTLGTISYSAEEDRSLNEMLRALGYDYESLVGSAFLARHKDTDFLNVEFSSENPYLSAFAANALCEEFLRYYRTIKSAKKNSSVTFFEKQVKDKLLVLSEKKNDLNKFKLDNDIVDLTEQQSSILKQISEFELRREEERKKIPGYRNAIETFDKGQASGAQSFEELQTKNKRINNLRSELNFLNDKYISGGSKDKKLQEKIELLKEELRLAISEASTSSSSKPAENQEALFSKNMENEMELELAKTSVQSLDIQIQRLENQLKILVSLEPTITALEREITFAEEDYQTAVKDFSKAKTEQVGPGVPFKHIEGTPPKSPEPTKQVFFALFSGMLSFAFAVVVIFVLEYLDLSMKTPSQFEKFTNVKLLGYLNQINFISFNLDINFIDINLESIFHNKNDNQQLETFKQLIRKIRFEVESSEAKRFLITSTREGEGKTFFLISLAYSLSLNGKNVLLVDTNFKNNTLSAMLGAKPALEKHFNQDLVKENIISKTKLKGLDIIGCYEGNYSPSEVFSQTNFQHLIDDLAKSYDFIFLEGAALNEYSDSKELITSADKVIAVFSTNTVIRDQDKDSIAYLRGLGDRFMGAILNKVDISNMT